MRILRTITAKILILLDRHEGEGLNPITGQLGAKGQQTEELTTDD